MSLPEPLPATRLTPKEYISLASHYRVTLVTDFVAPCPPTVFGRVEGRESGEVLAYLWFSPGLEIAGDEGWWMFAPECASEAVEDRFA